MKPIVITHILSVENYVVGMLRLKLMKQRFMIIHKQTLTGPITEFRSQLIHKPLCVQLQRDIPCIWYVVDPNAGAQTYTVYLFPTGVDIDESTLVLSEYVGSIQFNEMVYHAFLSNR